MWKCLVSFPHGNNDSVSTKHLRNPRLESSNESQKLIHLKPIKNNRENLVERLFN